MANPPVVLDTNVFNDRGFMRWLSKYRGEKEVPPVVYCELAVIAVQRTGDTSKLDGLLHAGGIFVSEMLMEHARFAATFAQEAADWKSRWRDYMIAGHAAIAPRHLITADTRGFGCLGKRAVRPGDFMDGIEDGSIH